MIQGDSNNCYSLIIDQMPATALNALRTFELFNPLNTPIVLCSVMPDSCDPMDCSPPGSSVQEILQARILEWGAISYS